MRHTFTALAAVPRPCLTHGSIDAALACLFTPTAAAILGLNHLMTHRCELDTLLFDTLSLSNSKWKISEGQVHFVIFSCYKVELKIFIECLIEVISIVSHSHPYLTVYLSVSCFRCLLMLCRDAQQMCQKWWQFPDFLIKRLIQLLNFLLFSSPSIFLILAPLLLMSFKFCIIMSMLQSNYNMGLLIYFFCFLCNY